MKLKTKACPHCKGIIASDAKKCKHCGEWLVLSEDEKKIIREDEETAPSFYNRFQTSFGIAFIGWLLFFFGSWHLIINAQISLMTQWLSTGNLKMQDFILESTGLVIRINDGYYGIVRDSRFFDSPILQWIMLLLALFAFAKALSYLFLGKFDSED